VKRFNYRHIICIVITLGFILCGIFIFPSALGRIIESGRDFGLSAAYFFCELFGIKHGIKPTVNTLPVIPLFPSQTPSPPKPSIPLPDTFDGFKGKFSAYWTLFVNSNNVLAYLAFMGNMLYTFCLILLFAVPAVVILRLAFSRYFNKTNNDYDRDSKPLRLYKKAAFYVFIPVKNFAVSLVNFIKEQRYYRMIWLLLWLFYFNAFTILSEFFAYYLYFVVSFDLGSLYLQVYKLFIDLSAVLTFVPPWAWVIIGLALFDRFRKNIAYMRLNHFERRNRGFINARPVVYMTCGTMGKKKTTAITDMALSQEVMLRDKAFEKLLENDLKFPYFPWIVFENELRQAMSLHKVYNLATCRKFVHILAEWNKVCRNLNTDSVKSVKRYIKRRYGIRVSFTALNCFGYDSERYGDTFDDGLKITSLWEVLETYAQLYFIYIVQSSLLLSNYSIREDNFISDLGNFPMWDSDFFCRDSRLIDSYSRHSHILDFDALRLGQKVLKNNRQSDSFEFGVIVITEVGKERGNKESLDGKRKTDKTVNQKNDGFNDWLKMVRHSATVDNFPFVKVITDEQRPESLGADARDLTDIVHIEDSGETRLAMPFFTLAELLYSLLFGKFTSLYYRYRFVRSDNTLFMYLFKAITAAIHGYYARIYNRFGYCVLRVQVESGTQDGRTRENKYYLMSKKIYSKRFSTDCFSDFFTEKALRSPIGIDDLREYATEKATFAELKRQNSHFIRDLTNKRKE